MLGASAHVRAEGLARELGAILLPDRPNRTGIQVIQMSKGKHLPSVKLVQTSGGCDCYAASDYAFKLKSESGAQKSETMLNRMKDFKCAPQFFGVDWNFEYQVSNEAEKPQVKIPFYAESGDPPRAIGDSVPEIC